MHVGAPAGLNAQQTATVRIGSSDIGGAVTGPNGPEAGVWVIAETTDLPTKFARIVVTDDQGRYLIPDLPKANYSVWVRGYGLVDSPKLRAAPGKLLNLTAVPAPNEAAAAHYYPAIYWYSMLKIPDANEFGGKGAIPGNITQAEWLAVMKSRSCIGCHQLGQAVDPHDAGSIRRYQVKRRGVDAPRAIRAGRSADGEPARRPPRWGAIQVFRRLDRPHRQGPAAAQQAQAARGIERNVVVTWWEWSDPRKYLHDLISSDRRYPTVNANGPLFGSPEYSTDMLPILNPKTHTVTYFRAPVRDEDTPEALGPGHAAIEKPLQPSPYWGDEKLWDSRANNHNSMFDKKGRLWLAAAVRGGNNPDFCKKGSSHPSAKLFPIEKNVRQLAILDPKTMKYTFVDTCFGSHHLQFGYDANDTLWTSGGGPVAGWLNTKKFDETGDVAASQGWTAFVLDTNANGKRDAYTEPNQPIDPSKDMRITGGSGTYAVMPSPVDGSIWYTVGVFAGRGAVLRLAPGAEPTGDRTR